MDIAIFISAVIVIAAVFYMKRRTKARKLPLKFRASRQLASNSMWYTDVSDGVRMWGGLAEMTGSDKGILIKLVNPYEMSNPTWWGQWNPTDRIIEINKEFWMDSKYTPAERASLIAHEVGHAAGLDHTKGPKDMMNPKIIAVFPTKKEIAMMKQKLEN